MRSALLQMEVGKDNAQKLWVLSRNAAKGTGEHGNSDIIEGILKRVCHRPSAQHSAATLPRGR